jgi:hypothetical protein
MNTFPIQRAHEILPIAPEARWLIESLWGADSVGILGGEPKSCKSYLALSMAVAVSSGAPLFGRFPIHRKGGVLHYAAEDALHSVRERLDGITNHQGLRLEDLAIWLITAPSLRLDIAEDRQRLLNTVSQIKPALLILDPFVRLHKVDENVSSAVAPLLGFLREVQRKEGCAITLVHHARKGASRIRQGQALRGTSEFHGWADSCLYLRRRGDKLTLGVEHRSHPPYEDMTLRLAVSEKGTALTIVDDKDWCGEPSSVNAKSDQERVLEALRPLDAPIRLRQLRIRCHIKMENLARILPSLEKEGLVEKTKQGIRLLTPTTTSEDPTEPTQFEMAFPIASVL